MKNVIAIAISALFATAAFASPITVPATVSTGGVAGLAGVSAAVGGTSSASLAGGSSQSGAQSLQAATIAVTSSYNIPGGAVGQAATATIGAVGTTSSQNYAYNLSSGAASGGAATVGQAFQGAAGSAQTHSSNTSNAEIPTGYASGAEGSKVQQSRRCRVATSALKSVSRPTTPRFRCRRTPARCRRKTAMAFS
jgi:hypothetical protein